MSVINGYNEYLKKKLPKIKNNLKGIEKGQSPKTLFITCSDSRICPNELTNTSYGELFVLRNAGNSIPHKDEQIGSSDAATLEYAVKVLGVEEIVVCGHSHCGAMDALISGINSNELPQVGNYLKRFETFKFNVLKEDTELINVIRRNILQQIKNIASYDFVKDKLDKGRLSLRGWLYHLETGEVDFL